MSEQSIAEKLASSFTQLAQVIKEVKTAVETGTVKEAEKVGGLTVEEIVTLAKDNGLIHIGPTEPTDSQYVAWLSTAEEDFDLFLDVGTESRNWTTVIKPGPKGDQGPAGGTTVNIPASFGIPYPTDEVFDGKTVWACRLDCGAFVSNVRKDVSIPAVVTSEWDKTSSYVPRLSPADSTFTLSTGESITLPYGGNSSSTSVAAFLSLDSNIVSVVSSLASTQTIITIRYVKQPV